MPNDRLSQTAKSFAASAPAFWSAAVLCRFAFGQGAASRKAPEGWRTPKAWPIARQRFGDFGVFECVTKFSLDLMREPCILLIGKQGESVMLAHNWLRKSQLPNMRSMRQNEGLTPRRGFGAITVPFGKTSLCMQS